MTASNTLPNLIDYAQTTEERFLRQIFVRDQMAEWSKRPLIMARADGVHYWDTEGKRYLDGISGIYQRKKACFLRRTGRQSGGAAAAR